MTVDGKFYGTLEVKYLDGRLWTVVHGPDPLVFVLEDGRKIEPPEGMTTDFASIPRFFWDFLPPCGDGSKAEYGYGAVIHDYLYQTGKIEGVPIERRYADAVFFACNMAVGVEPWKCRLMDWALALGGWRTWDNYRKHDAKS